MKKFIIFLLIFLTSCSQILGLDDYTIESKDTDNDTNIGTDIIGNDSNDSSSDGNISTDTETTQQNDSDIPNPVDTGSDTNYDTDFGTSTEIDTGTDTGTDTAAEIIILTTSKQNFPSNIYLADQSNCTDHMLILTENSGTEVETNINGILISFTNYKSINMGATNPVLITVTNSNIEYSCY